MTEIERHRGSFLLHYTTLTVNILEPVYQVEL